MLPIKNLYKDTNRLKVKGEKKIHHVNTNQKTAFTDRWKNIP